MLTSEVLKFAFPALKELIPGKNTNQAAEPRNHILVSRYITEVALNNTGTTDIYLAHIKQLSVMMLRGTDAETLYAHSWGKSKQIGEYRSAPLSVRSNRIASSHILKKFLPECNAILSGATATIPTRFFV